jgi:hypothetical protein
MNHRRRPPFPKEADLSNDGNLYFTGQQRTRPRTLLKRRTTPPQTKAPCLESSCGRVFFVRGPKGKETAGQASSWPSYATSQPLVLPEPESEIPHDRPGLGRSIGFRLERQGHCGQDTLRNSKAGTEGKVWQNTAEPTPRPSKPRAKGRTFAYRAWASNEYKKRTTSQN